MADGGVPVLRGTLKPDKDTYKRRGRVLQAWLPEEIAQIVRQTAAEWNLSVSTIVMWAIYAFLDNDMEHNIAEQGKHFVSVTKKYDIKFPPAPDV